MRQRVMVVLPADARDGLMRDGGGRKNGSPGQTRTADKVVNSHLLYQLSYRGMRDANPTHPQASGQAETVLDECYSLTLGLTLYR